MPSTTTASRETNRKNHLKTAAQALMAAAAAEKEADFRDCVGAILNSLWDIFDELERTCRAWEKRGFAEKSARFQEQWRWIYDALRNLGQAVKHSQWDAVRASLVQDLAPNVASVRIPKTERGFQPEWRGSLKRAQERNLFELIERQVRASGSTTTVIHMTPEQKAAAQAQTHVAKPVGTYAWDRPWEEGGGKKK